MYENEYFDQADEYSDQSPVVTRYSIPPNMAKVLIGIAVVVLLVAGWHAIGWLSGKVLSSDVQVYLEGAHIDQLRPGARVVVGSLVVGEVTGVETRDGEAVATLRIDGKHASQIGTSARFQVDSLNHWMPGNTGVRIYPASEHPSPRALAVGDRLMAADTMLPASVPIRFYGLLAGCAVMLAAVTMLAKVFVKGVVRLTVIVAGVLVIAGAVFYLSNVVTLP